MNLRDYLHFERIKQNKFAASIDMSVAQINAYLNGRQRLSKKVAKNIEKITEGKVTAKEILKGNPPKKPIQKIENCNNLESL